MTLACLPASGIKVHDRIEVESGRKFSALDLFRQMLAVLGRDGATVIMVGLMLLLMISSQVK